MSEKHPELAAFMAAYPDINQVLVILTDLNGIARGKLVRPHELKAMYERGRPLPASILAMNSLGEDVDETGLVWDVGDMDCMARPVPGSLKICPWMRDTAQVLLTMDETLGMPAAFADPRRKLEQVIGRMQADGYNPVLACELEFYLLDAESWHNGEVRPASANRGPRLEQPQVYGIQELQDLAEFFEEIYRCAAIQGLPAETAISEYAPGQYEITLAHRDDALRAVDEAIQFKRLVKGVAEQFGMIACFMAKPFSDLSGSGMHVHVSLADAEGRNLCAGETEQGSELLRHAIGGMAATIPDCMAIFAPNANSYRRFRRKSYAPIAPTWGVNNRTVTFRVPAGPPENCHVEHRACGADANPYLAAAAVLAGMHHGIRNQIDPGPPVKGDGYEKTGEVLTINWWDALDAFEQSAFIEDYFGTEFRRVFVAIKRDECSQFFSEVSELDHRWHLRRA